MNEESELEVLSQDESQTQGLGHAIGMAVQGGEVVGLVGELGAGKTCLVKGIAGGLGVYDESDVRSPTFVLIREHAGRFRLFHMDAYRLCGSGDLGSLGFDEILDQGGLTVVEWADHVAEALPEDRLTLRLAITGAQSRHISLSCGGRGSRELLARLGKEWGA